MREENSMSISAKNSTLFTFLKTHEIDIPNYQREYAQGRKNDRAAAIRDNLINDYYRALTGPQMCVDLDCVFGGESNDGESRFLPVDGQQRLTSLFLLHWYIYFLADNREGLELLKGFHYCTRTTSDSFCGNLCEMKRFSADVPFSKETVSMSIRNMPWFTGTMKVDPTVDSMLTVLDCIQEKFSSCDFQSLSKKLSSEDCPITFYALNIKDSLGGEDGIKDLYIKMNARGVPLTDFEIFKAELQKEKEAPLLDIVAEYLCKNMLGGSTQKNRSFLIGKFNNEYADFFFKTIDEGKIIDALDQSKDMSEKSKEEQSFDRAMMNFIKEVFCINYFAAVGNKYSEKDYRNSYNNFMKMNGKMFSAFITKCGSTFNSTTNNTGISLEVDRSVFSTAFKNLIQLFDSFCEPSFSFGSKRNGCAGFNAESLFKKLAEKAEDSQKLSMPDMISRNALYEFLLRFGYPSDKDKKEAYEYWQRFVWKVTKNTDVKNLAEALNIYTAMIKALPARGEAVCTKSLIEGISRLSFDAGAAKLQIEEEVKKAGMILANPDLRKDIEEAEDYFCHDGQIWFMFDLMDKSDRTFCDVFARVKQLFLSDSETGQDKKYKWLREEYASLFERALLASAESDKLHLLPMNGSTYAARKMVNGNYSELLSHYFAVDEKIRYETTTSFLAEIIQENPEDLRQWLDAYISEKAGKITEDWQKVLVMNDLIEKSVDGLSFKNVFEPGWKHDAKEYTKVFTTSNRRIEWGELHSFVLAVKLKEKGLSPEYIPSKEDSYLDEESHFPRCYFLLGENKVAFFNESFYKNTLKDDNKLGDTDDAVKALLDQIKA